jgi:hypothetical protein
MDFLFPGQNQTTDLSKLVTFYHYPVDGDDQILPILNLVVGYFAFVPLPVIQSSLKYANIEFGNIGLTSTLDGTPLLTMAITSPTEKIKIVTETDNADKLVVDIDKTIPQWPLNSFGYFVYQENASDDYNSILYGLRFAYWIFNNSLVQDTTEEFGFYFVGLNIIPHLLQAELNGKKLLVYNNLSVHGRSNAVLGISLVFTFIFAVGVLYGSLIPSLRSKGGIQQSTHIILAFIGLILSFVSYVLWYLPPSETWICIARNWFYGFGMTCVLSSIFLYGFVLQLLYMLDIGRITVDKETPFKGLLIMAFIVLLLELVILLIWTYTEEPHGHEIVIDPIEWTSRYTCTIKSWVMDLIQYIFFCLLSALSPIVINRYCRKFDTMEDALSTFQHSIVVFMILVMITVMSRVMTLNDEQAYSMNVIMWVAVQGLVVYTWVRKSISKMVKKLGISTSPEVGSFKMQNYTENGTQTFA